VKGFGEVSALHAAMRPVAEISGPGAQRFLQALPRATRTALWAVPDGRTLTLTMSPRPGAACLAAPERLAELRPLLRFVTRLRVYAPAADRGSLPSASAWELTLGAAGARLTLTLSPEKYRGFTGEGALLDALATGADADGGQAEFLALLLGWDPVVSLPRLAASAGLSAERTVATLAHLATSGRVGYDLHDGAYFHRELPLGMAVERAHPRLSDARKLAAEGLVTLTEGGAQSGEHRVTFAAAGEGSADACTCPWWGKHQGSRGPCKHVLAARIILSESAVVTR
jgi:hypothetical protein